VQQEILSHKKNILVPRKTILAVRKNGFVTFYPENILLSSENISVSKRLFCREILFYIFKICVSKLVYL